MEQIFTKLMMPQLVSELTENGTASSLWIELTQNDTLQVENVIEFVLIEKMGD